MARPDVHLVELRSADEVDSARRHEAKRALDLGGELLVAAALGDEATNSWFHSCTRMRSAKPPFVNARTRLSVAVAWL